MENSNEENIQTLEETNQPVDEQLPDIENTASSLLPTSNDEPQTPKQNTEEEEKPNEVPEEPKNAELISASPSESKVSSKNASAKLSSRSSQQTAVKQDVRAYLEEKVFPVLTNGLEELLKAVDERNKKLNEEEEEEEETKIPEINPLFFLARYLMRNAPHSSSEASRASSQHSQERIDVKEENASKEQLSTQEEESVNAQNDDESQATEM